MRIFHFGWIGFRRSVRGIILFTLISASGARSAQEGIAPAAPASSARTEPAPSATPGTGLILNSEGAMPGYTLFAPLDSTTTYLIDTKGEVVHTWESRFVPGQSVYLLPDGSLLRCAREPNYHQFSGGGIGGRVERLAPDGKLLWEYICADERRCLHHDIEPLPNGNILMIAWEKKTRDEALAAGRDPRLQEGDELWPDCILEVRPQGDSGGQIVWEWHVWDHLVQEYDKTKPNYGVVADHPELIDLNYRRSGPRETPADIQRLRGLGYIGGGHEKDEDSDDGSAAARRRAEAPSRDGNAPPDNGGGPPFPGRGRGPGGMNMRADMCHINAIAYHPKLDQIVLSVHTFNEIWIIDHSTTTEQAAGHTGGRYGRGGDLLYRWGNPRAYGAGSSDDQQLFAQHDAHWIAEGLPGAGRLLIFNNGLGRRDGAYSSVIEIEPPMEAGGRYRYETGKPFGPSRPQWEYVAAKKTDFYSSRISGAQRLRNGNTLICSGETGRIFEIDREGKVVWDYVNPFRNPRGPRGEPPGGFWGPPGGPTGGTGHNSPRQHEGLPQPDPETSPRPADTGTATSTNESDDPHQDRPRSDQPSPNGMLMPPRPVNGGPPGRWSGGPPGPFGGMPGGLFRATRIAADDLAVMKLLSEKPPVRKGG